MKNINKLKNNFIENGFVILKNSVSKKLIKDIKFKMFKKIRSVSKNKSNFKSAFKEILKKHGHFNVQSNLMNFLIFNDYPRKILMQKKLIFFLTNVIGPDLEHELYPELPINIKSNKKEYFIKDFHQEFWSGSGEDVIHVWVPLHLKKNMGTIEFVRGSHLWGHIKHKDRKPVISIDTKKIYKPENIKEGDAILFHSLTLHRTVPSLLEEPRITYSTGVKNIYANYTNFDNLKSWNKFNLSLMTIIKKQLGNSHLSEFRVTNNKKKRYYAGELKKFL